MRKIFILLQALILISTAVCSQDKKDEKPKVGLFKNLNTRMGFTMSYFYNFQGEYVYILQQNARVVEKQENQRGASLSVVVLFPFDEESKYNFLLNLPLLDIKSGNVESNENIFNSQTPFGVGFAWFPLNKANFFGLSGMFNFGRQNRMRKEAIDTRFFPIADYPNQGLAVGAPVPESILKPFFYKETTYSVYAGLVIRL